MLDFLAIRQYILLFYFFKVPRLIQVRLLFLVALALLKYLNLREDIFVTL